MLKKIALSGALILSSVLSACTEADISGFNANGIDGRFEKIIYNEIELRAFLQDMPKGADLHNHLYGAVYAEDWIKWAEEDGLCLATKPLAIRYPGNEGCGQRQTVKSALAGNQDLRNQLIEKLSLRDYVASQGWSGHDQFFATFGSMAALPSRFGDMVASTANLAGQQNISYLELMHTMELFETILPMVGGLNMSGNAEQDYKTLMESEFGKALPEMVKRARKDIDAAMARKDELLACGTENAQPGCAVEIRFINQPVRTLPLAAVYAHQIFGWELMKQDNRFVATNLVAPEDDFIALRDYDAHMAELDYLYKNLGPRNVSLHAGELWLGLVHPENLRDHIRLAIEKGHAKRIGHGTDIIFETDYPEILQRMKDENIAVEINLTSSDAILGVEGGEHPLIIYKNAGIPIVLSTDDEGVARIDLTHEYVRAVQEFDLSYQQLKQMSYNGIKYSFADKETKERLLKELDEKFARFESTH